MVKHAHERADKLLSEASMPVSAVLSLNSSS